VKSDPAFISETLAGATCRVECPSMVDHFSAKSNPVMPQRPGSSHFLMIAIWADQAFLKRIVFIAARLQ
jgi:hypothetical protein